MTKPSMIRLPGINAFGAWAAVCAIVLQALLAGASVSAAPAGAGDIFACAPLQNSDAAPGGVPAAPLRHHVACCILHQAAFDDPLDRIPILRAVAPRQALPAPAWRYVADAPGTPPELASLAARAPPLPFV